jgi:hypothetical protein
VEEIANWRSGWQEQLAQKFEGWKAVDLGRNFRMIQAKNRETVERGWDAIRSENEERNWSDDRW